MATKLTEEGLTREISVIGINNPVILTIDTNGIRARIKGARKCTMITWTTIINHSITSTDVPAWLYNKPFQLLLEQDKAKTKG